MRKLPAALLIALVVAGCGDGDRIHVDFTVTNGPGGGFARRGDALGNPCAPFKDAGIALAEEGKVTVRDQANALVGVSPLSPGKLTEVKSLPGDLIEQTCLLNFDVDIKGSPSFLTFELAWTGSSTTVTASVDANAVKDGRLKISKNPS